MDHQAAAAEPPSACARSGSEDNWGGMVGGPASPRSPTAPRSGPPAPEAPAVPSAQASPPPPPRAPLAAPAGLAQAAAGRRRASSDVAAAAQAGDGGAAPVAGGRGLGAGPVRSNDAALAPGPHPGKGARGGGLAPGHLPPARLQRPASVEPPDELGSREARRRGGDEDAVEDGGEAGREGARAWLNSGQRWLAGAGRKVVAAAKDAQSSLQSRLGDMDVFAPKGAAGAFLRPRVRPGHVTAQGCGRCQGKSRYLAWPLCLSGLSAWRFSCHHAACTYS